MVFVLESQCTTAPATRERPSSGRSGSSAKRRAALRLCGSARIAPRINVRNSSRAIDPMTSFGLLSAVGHAARKPCVWSCVRHESRSIAGYQVLAGRASDLDTCRTSIGAYDLELDA